MVGGQAAGSNAAVEESGETNEEQRSARSESMDDDVGLADDYDSADEYDDDLYKGESDKMHLLAQVIALVTVP